MQCNFNFTLFYQQAFKIGFAYHPLHWFELCLFPQRGWAWQALGKQGFVGIGRLPSICSRESKAAGYSFLCCLGRTGLVALPLIVWFHFMWYSQLYQECATHEPLFCLFFHYKVTVLRDGRHNRLDILHEYICQTIIIHRQDEKENSCLQMSLFSEYCSDVLLSCINITFIWWTVEKEASFLVQEKSGTTNCKCLTKQE